MKDELFEGEANQLLHLQNIEATVYVSPLQRCAKLATYLFEDKYTTDDRLKEMNFGKWEMQDWHDIPTEEITPWMNDYFTVAPPEGESMEQVIRRVKAFLDELNSQPSERCIIVAHAGVIRIAVGLLLKTPQAEWMSLKVGYGEVVKVEY